MWYKYQITNICIKVGTQEQKKNHNGTCNVKQTQRHPNHTISTILFELNQTYIHTIQQELDLQTYLLKYRLIRYHLLLTI